MCNGINYFLKECINNDNQFAPFWSFVCILSSQHKMETENTQNETIPNLYYEKAHRYCIYVLNDTKNCLYINASQPGPLDWATISHRCHLISCLALHMGKKIAQNA